jgi:hypothetical protein
MPLRLLKVGLILAVPVLWAASDDSRPACTSQIQGRMWPDAANHDPKVISRLARCGELFICVRGSWHYHWQAPSVRVDQLAHGPKHPRRRLVKRSPWWMLHRPIRPDGIPLPVRWNVEFGPSNRVS